MGRERSLEGAIMGFFPTDCEGKILPVTISVTLKTWILPYVSCAVTCCVQQELKPLVCVSSVNMEPRVSDGLAVHSLRLK